MKNSEFESCAGQFMGMIFGPPMLILGVGLVANAIATVVAVLCSITQAVTSFGIALSDLARSSGVWSLVIAQLVIGLLIGFALGLRTPRAR